MTRVSSDIGVSGIVSLKAVSLRPRELRQARFPTHEDTRERIGRLEVCGRERRELKPGRASCLQTP